VARIFNLSEAKDQLSSPVDRAASGEEPREPSNTLGLIYMADDFDAPLPPELLKLFGHNP